MMKIYLPSRIYKNLKYSDSIITRNIKNTMELILK